MSILSKLTVTPLLYACGALLALALGLSVALKLEAGKVETAGANLHAAQESAVSLITQRDAWKGKAEGAVDANRAAGDAIASLKATLETQQLQCRANQAANTKAIASARADAAEADRTLKLFAKKFQTESRKPDCDRALAAMEAACPALQDY